MPPEPPEPPEPPADDPSAMGLLDHLAELGIEPAATIDLQVIEPDGLTPASLAIGRGGRAAVLYGRSGRIQLLELVHASETPAR